MASLQDRHNAAIKVIKAYEQDGVPFVLYFRKFDFTILHGQNDRDRYLMENYLLSNLPQSVNLITIQEPEDVSAGFTEDTVWTRKAPALGLDDSLWQQIAEELVWRADIIISEYWVLSKGVEFELTTCVKNVKFDQTVLILPPPESMFATLDDEELIQRFPRVTWANEFHRSNLLDSFVIADLVERVKSIAQLPKKERVRLVENKKRLAHYPITYRGVVQGYKTKALMLELEADDVNEYWHYKFWYYFRAVSILSLQLLRKEVDLEKVGTEISDCYLKLGYLCLTGYQEDDKFVFTGDLEFAKLCAHNAYLFASKVQSTPFVLLTENLFKEIDLIERAITANPHKVIIQPRRKPIVSRRGKVPD